MTRRVDRPAQSRVVRTASEAVARVGMMSVLVHELILHQQEPVSFKEGPCGIGEEKFKE